MNSLILYLKVLQNALKRDYTDFQKMISQIALIEIQSV